jgi:hypothetical protein
MGCSKVNTDLAKFLVSQNRRNYCSFLFQKSIFDAKLGFALFSAILVSGKLIGHFCQVKNIFTEDLVVD